MNVIGIIQTDLNEFSVLFDQQQQGDHGQGQDQQQSNARNGESQDSEENDSMFLSFLDEPMGGGNDNKSGSQQQGQQKNGPQEMTVRIKGIPEGQKANFLQMYQILQDAKDTNSLHQSLTIVQQGDQQEQQGQQGQQGQKGQGKSQ